MINRSRVFKMAHAIYDSRNVESWSEALRTAWSIEKRAHTAEARLAKLGFKHWQKGGYDRWYINTTKLGLELEYYKTGNISGAWYCGEKTSNCQGGRIKNLRVWVDAVDGKANAQGYDYYWVDEMRERAGRLWAAAA